jgi:hypothetical protein
MRRLLFVLALVGCGGAGDSGVPTDDASTSGDGGVGDAPAGCVVDISYEPTKPVAAADGVVRLKALVQGAPGVQSYTWTVRLGGTLIPTEPALPDNSEVTFAATTAATFEAFLDVEVPQLLFCPQGHAIVEVKTPGAGEDEFRVHIVAPPGESRPPLDERVIVVGGPEDSLDDFVLAEGGIVDGFVRGDGTPIAAYLKFMPITGKDAAVESFSDTAGLYSAFLRSEAHEVLVIPTSPSYAPRLVTWMPGQTSLDVTAGTTISGVVRDQANALLPNATVQLTIGGVPSTIATTNASGAFTVRAVSIPGALVTFDVTAPAARGLPRIIVSSTMFDVTQPITIRYRSTTVRDLAGTIVRRSGNPLPGADVSVVAELPNIADVTAGATLPAGGEVRATATTNASGALPSLRVPAAPLSAVVVPAPGDLAVTALDLTTAIPASISALPMVAVTTRTRDPRTTPPPLISGVTLDAIPLGALQLSGAPTIRVTSDAAGTISTSFAAGGQYELRFSDPAGRGALLTVPSVTASTIAPSHTLRKATTVTAVVKGSSSIKNASVQILCSSCTGLERSRPIAEGVTGIDGRFSLAVPDPSAN